MKIVASLLILSLLAITGRARSPRRLPREAKRLRSTHSSDPGFTGLPRM